MSKKLVLFTIIAMLLGSVIGLVAPSFMNHFDFLGIVYVNLLKSIMVPLVFISITLTVSKYHKTSSRTIIEAIILFIIMFTCTFILNSTLVQLFKPGIDYTYEAVEWQGEVTQLSLQSFFSKIFPSNIFGSFVNGDILPVMIAAFIIGLNIEDKSALQNVFNDLNNALGKITQWIILTTPFGVFSLSKTLLIQHNFKTILLYGGFAITGCVLTWLIVMVLPLIACGVNPIRYLANILKIWSVTFTTCSSAATLPHTLKTCVNDFGVSERIANIVVPLGCTIHMCGGAVSFSLLALFNMQAFGISLTFTKFVLMLVVALVINMGAPGIPGGGIIIGATYLSLLGIPLEFIGIYAGIYKVLDMFYTTMNVTGDITANILINKMENIYENKKSKITMES